MIPVDGLWCDVEFSKPRASGDDPKGVLPAPEDLA